MTFLFTGNFGGSARQRGQRPFASQNSAGVASGDGVDRWPEGPASEETGGLRWSARRVSKSARGLRVLIRGVLAGAAIALGCVSPLLANSNDRQTVLLNFYATWCGPCQRMEPVVAQLQQAGYPVRRVNIEQEPGLARRFGITAVPTFVMLVEGRETGRIVGPASLDQLMMLCRMAPQSPPRREETPPPSSVPLASTAVPAHVPQSAGSVVANSAGQSNVTLAATGLRSLPDFDPRCRFASPQRDDLLAVTVRIRINDPQGRSTGSGTIIDARGGEALIVTCGHLFRESGGKFPILVDLFGPEPVQNLPGQLIFYDDKLDIGFVSIRPGRPVVVARVAPPGYPLAVGDAVFSVGCGDGQPPEVWEGKVTGLNKYLGPANIQASRAPVVGRSGGGLFSSDGFLIGVCNAADPPLNEGIYLALKEIHQALDRLNLAVVYRTEGIALAAAPTREQSGPASQALGTASVPSGGAEGVGRSQPSGPEILSDAGVKTPQDGPVPSFPDALAQQTDSATSPEAVTLAAGLPLPVSPVAASAGGSAGATEVAARNPFVAMASLPTGGSSQPGRFPQETAALAGGGRADSAAIVAGLSDEERAAWEEITKRQARGFEIVCVVRSLDAPNVPSEVIVLRQVSPEFLALLQKEGVTTLNALPGGRGEAGQTVADRHAQVDGAGSVPLVPIAARKLERPTGGASSSTLPRPSVAPGSASASNSGPVVLPAAVVALPSSVGSR